MQYSVWRPSVRLSVCPSFVLTLISARRILNVTHQGAASDAASVHFDPTIRRTDIVVKLQVIHFAGNSPLHRLYSLRLHVTFINSNQYDSQE